jgi:hypothetical protein
MKSIQNRMNFLQDYFEQEKTFMIKFYISKKNKKGKSVVKKLNLIDNGVRNKILKIYMEKCVFEYGIKFNQWRIKAFGEGLGLDPKEIQSRLEMLQKKESMLY